MKSILISYDKFRDNLHLLSKYKFYLSIILVSLLIKLVLLIYLRNSTLTTPDSDKYIAVSNKFLESYISGPNKEYFSSPESISDFTLQILPIYPLFLKVFFLSLPILIITQIIIHSLISFIALSLLTKIESKQSEFIKGSLFIMIQLETTLFIYTFRILTEILFALFVVLVVYLILSNFNKKSNINSRYLATFTTLVMVFLTRPTSLAFCIAFFLMTILAKNRKKYFILLLISIFIYTSYGLFNYTRSGIFTNSTIQNSNFLRYEAAGARALTLGVPLIEVQNEESLIRQKMLEGDPSLKTYNKYNFDRAIEILINNKMSFIKLHLIGVLKVLYGPNRSEILQVINDSGRISSPVWLSHLILFLAFLVTILISTLGIIGMARYFFRNDDFKFIACLILSFLLISGGAQAYGRFRAPISVFLAIFAAIQLNDVFSELKRRYLKKS
jgi:hypothetical protein